MRHAKKSLRELSFFTWRGAICLWWPVANFFWSPLCIRKNNLAPLCLSRKISSCQGGQSSLSKSKTNAVGTWACCACWSSRSCWVYDNDKGPWWPFTRTQLRFPHWMLHQILSPCRMSTSPCSLTQHSCCWCCLVNHAQKHLPSHCSLNIYKLFNNRIPILLHSLDSIRWLFQLVSEEGRTHLGWECITKYLSCMWYMWHPCILQT